MPMAMRIDDRALRLIWRQTVWATALAMVGVAGMLVYALASAAPDHSAVRFFLLLLFAMPVMLGVAYLIRRFIEGLAD